MIETFGSDQVIFLLIVMALTATVAGFFAGFFGIGGGIITVPCLFYIFNSIGIDKSEDPNVSKQSTLLPFLKVC